jgi:hypothetical protein
VLPLALRNNNHQQTATRGNWSLSQ